MASTSAPLADYFWIAGIENISFTDAPQPPPTPPVESTIAEDGELQEDDASIKANSRATARHSRHNSVNLVSKLSLDGRFSVHTLEEVDGNTRSNRSSATIRPSQLGNTNGAVTDTTGGMSEFDFDKALIKFAAERENFLDDLSFSAGAKLQSRPPMVNPRAERIRADEIEPSGRRSPLRSVKGSIRRKMSFRDMTSLRRQPAAPKPGMSGLTQHQI